MKLNDRETADLCRSLHLLLHAGIGMADSIHLLAKEESGPRAELLREMGRKMDDGSRLSEAMLQSGAFPASVSAMTAIGEETGTLEEALSSLADYHDQRHRTNRQIKNALAYPSLILLLMLGVVGVLLVKVLPVFASVYASLGGQLTGLSGTLLHLGQGLQKLLPVLFTVLAAFAAAVAVFALCPGLAEKAMNRVRRRFGDRGVLRNFNNARFARALAMGMGSGLTVEEALDLAAKLLADIPAAAARCETCAVAVREGEDLSDALEKASLLPPARSRMLSVGIRSGSADTIMAEVADRMMEDAEETLSSLVGKIEPAMVLTASLLVGAILLSVMLPLLDIMSTVG